LADLPHACPLSYDAPPAPATYPLSLHDALPISLAVGPTGMPIVWTVGSDSGNQTTSAAFSDTKGTVTATLTGLVPGSSAYVMVRSEEHTSELQSRENLVCRLLLEKKKRSYAARS